jgi:putative FmdB family regulatory protein
MPLYDFRCPRCDAVTEMLVDVSSKPSCPSCGGGELEKLLSPFATIGRGAALMATARAAAAREGHFSNYAPSERPKK